MVLLIWSFLVWLWSLQFLIELKGNKRHWALPHMSCRGSFPSPHGSARQSRSSQQWRSRQFAWNSLSYWVCKYRRHCGRAVSQTPRVISVSAEWTHRWQSVCEKSTTRQYKTCENPGLLKIPIWVVNGESWVKSSSPVVSRWCPATQFRKKWSRKSFPSRTSIMRMSSNKRLGNYTVLHGISIRWLMLPVLTTLLDPWRFLQTYTWCEKIPDAVRVAILSRNSRCVFSSCLAKKYQQYRVSTSYLFARLKKPLKVSNHWCTLPTSEPKLHRMIFLMTQNSERFAGTKSDLKNGRW